MFEIKRDPIYKHDHLDVREAERIRPLMESAFQKEFMQYKGAGNNASREVIAKERSKFISEQFANRMRIANNMGLHPLNEDAAIFGEAMPQLKNLFESISMPGNVIGMGEVTNPMNGNEVAGGMWNPGYKPGSGDIPTYVFGLQTHLAVHCIGFDLIPTIAVDTPKVVISYVDTVYGGGTFDDVENMPSYVEIGNPVFVRSWIRSSSLVRATTELVLVANDGKMMKVRFMVGSTVKAALTVEVLATGLDSSPAGTFYTDEWTNAYTVQEVVNAINLNITGAKVYVDGTPTSLSGTLTIDYASATRTNIAEAASNNNSLGGMSRAQHEKGPKHKLNVIVMDKQLEMVGLEIDADTSNIQIKDMAAMGVNVIAYLYSGVQNQLVQSIDEIILDHLYKLGVQHAVQAYQSQGLNHSLYIDNPSNTTKAVSAVDVDFKDILDDDKRTAMGNMTNALVSAAYENQMTHGERLYARILLILEFVGQQNRIAAPDFIVTSGTLAATLKKQSTFTACPVTTTLASNPELHYTGTIFETVSLYKNPKIDFDDPRILFGRRGNDTDPGAKFLAYDLAASRQIVAEGTMAEKIRVWSRFAIADIGFYPELNYYVALFINGYNWS